MVQDELLIEQLNQKQVGAFKILFDRFYRCHEVGRETRDCGRCRAGLIRAGVGTGYDLQFLLWF